MFSKDLYSWPMDLEYHIYIENDLFIVYALKEIFQKVYLVRNHQDGYPYINLF